MKTRCFSRHACLLFVLWVLCVGGAACTVTTEPIQKKEITGQTIERQWNYRLIAGVSMGGGFAAMLGLRHHEKFDIIGTLGGFNNHTYFLQHLKNMVSNGFCDLKKLEQAAKDGTLNEASSYCKPVDPKPQFPFELISDFNNWFYSSSLGNNGWNRNSLIRATQDVFYAFGNPAYYNPESTYYPPGVPKDWRDRPDRCADPIRIKKFYHDQYNPKGEYDVITFCDGTDKSGTFYPDKPELHNAPTEVFLALDLNGNGKRDYGEPVLITPHERYQDVGVDGCGDDREDGKGGCVPEGQKGPGGDDPNGDNYHPIKNPKGLEGNLQFDQGEPYKDFGLDGVEGTGDYGEKDGKFTQTPGYENFMKHDPYSLILKMTPAQLSRLNIYIDGGIRDLLNFQVTGINLLGAIRARIEKMEHAPLHERFLSLMPEGKGPYEPHKVDWSDKGQHLYIQYGNPNATPEEIAAGDGDHIHGVSGIINRVFSFYSFVAHQLPDADVEKVPLDQEKQEGVPLHFFYESKALGRQQIYSVVLPPGFHANPTKRYPVIYMGHGYGMSGPDMASVLAAGAGLMSVGEAAKMIGVSIHGSCDRIYPDPANPKRLRSEKAEGCHKGTLYVDNKGFQGNDGPKMESAFFEVIAEVEKRYADRIRQPEVRKYRLPLPPAK
ncbi:hypothetical protein L6R29_21245 [Myxococcota bacterium]|nr:hypothetical protein [Myxococcota bacterium]